MIVIDSTTPLSAEGPRVLLIDSNVSLLKLIKHYLSAHHYHVTTADSPEEGLQVLQDFPAGFDTVITSLRFRIGFTSLDYLNRLDRARGHARLVVTSGALPEMQEQFWLEERRIPFLPKPYQPPHLLRLLAQVSPLPPTPSPHIAPPPPAP